MESYLFADVEAAADTMVVEGYHKPGSLTRSSGAWIHAAGTAMFEAGRRPIKPPCFFLKMCTAIIPLWQKMSTVF